MRKIQKSPISRIRTRQADARIAELKAKGYQKKGDYKKEMAKIKLLSRTTDPQTVYVTSELHRDDVIDIEDFDSVEFQYRVDQISLKETLAVATMLGDDRLDSDPEKIFPEHIRPVWTDDELYTIHKDVDLIVYIPSHKRKEAKRGYNPAELLASYISKDLNIPVSKENLIKNKWTKDQSKLNRLDRTTNLTDSFYIKNKEEIKGRKILLIDDIITTGTTLKEVSKVLIQNGVKEIIGLTLTASKI